MKKLLLLAALSLSLTSYGQTLKNYRISRIIFEKQTEISEFDGYSTINTGFIEVPSGKIWEYIPNIISSSTNFKIQFDNGTNNNEYINWNNSSRNLLFPEGSRFRILGSNYINIIEYDVNTQTLTQATPSFQQKNILPYPNPTSGLVNIDTTKAKKVEVYDMKGIKILETTDTSIDFSNLSTAVYVVKLFDNNEELYASYKVVKN